MSLIEAVVYSASVKSSLVPFVASAFTDFGICDVCSLEQYRGGIISGGLQSNQFDD